MFYSNQMLSKKGALAVIWLAAHMDNRLKKDNIFKTNISGSVDTILNPEVPLALRLSGQLLLGVVNVYKRQLLYLFEDCNDALSKMQQAFKPASLTLPGDGKATAAQITLPDDFDISQLESLFNDAEDEYGALDLSQGLKLSLNTKDSLFLAEDATQLFRTPSSYRDADEEFEVGMDEFERHLSLDPPEKLRDAIMPTAQKLFETALASPNFRGDEMLPDVDMDALNFEPPPSSHRPSTGGISRAENDDAFTPIELDMGNFNDDFEPPQLELHSDSTRKRKEADTPTPKPAKQKKAKGGQKRQKVVRDLDATGQPATTIPAAAIRKLLADTSSLLREPQLMSKEDILARVYLSQQNLAKRGQQKDSWMTQPSISSCMAPELYALYPFALKDKANSGRNGQAKQKGRGEDEGTVQQIEEDQNDAEEADPPAPAGDDFPDHMDGPGFDDGPEDFGATGPEFEQNDNGYDDTYDINDNVDGNVTVDAHEPDSPPPSGSARKSLPASDMKEGSVRRPRPAEEDVIQEDFVEDDYDYEAADSFTARSQHVLKLVKSKMSGKSASGKKQRLSGKAAQGVDISELQNKGDRVEAARIFFELLVLQGRQQVTLSQPEPYSQIQVALPLSS